MRMESFYKVLSWIILLAGASLSPAFSQGTVDATVAGRELSVGLGFQGVSQRTQGYIGLGGGLVPEYHGSDDYTVTALPLAELRKPGAFFIKGADINPNHGLASAGLTVLHFTYSDKSDRRAQLLIGPFVRLHGGRDEEDSDTLDGLGEIDPSLGLGGFMEFRAGSWWADLRLSSQDVGADEDGLLITLDARHTIVASDKLTISPGLSVSWADDDYMQGFFGVSESQSSGSGLPRFVSRAGFKDVGIDFQASYEIAERLRLTGQLGYWRLLGEAADSPIVDDNGSANQVRTLLGLSYHF